MLNMTKSFFAFTLLFVFAACNNDLPVDSAPLDSSANPRNNVPIQPRFIVAHPDMEAPQNLHQSLNRIQAELQTFSWVAQVPSEQEFDRVFDRLDQMNDDAVPFAEIMLAGTVIRSAIGLEDGKSNHIDLAGEISPDESKVVLKAVEVLAEYNNPTIDLRVAAVDALKEHVDASVIQYHSELIEDSFNNFYTGSHKQGSFYGDSVRARVAKDAVTHLETLR
jgi:hypothetical protein